MVVNANEGRRAVAEVRYAVCKNCDAPRVKLEDDQPVQGCCGNFEK
jgi:hypothetical protein